MNKYEKILLDCKVGIKAFQNINASSMGFAKMLDLAKTEDPILMPSVFYWAVIRYAKPFLNSKFEGGVNIKYPIKCLKTANGFSIAMHDHLITVRRTLVAHDDFTEIPPRLLKFGIHIADENFFIPTSIAISNKCISFPISESIVGQMQLHAQSCCNAVHAKLIEDIEELRELTLSNPEVAMKDQKYTKNYGEAKIESEGSSIQPPDFMKDQWLDTPVPDYSELHNGYMYEEAKIKKDFHGPERIITPTGLVYIFSPSESK
jgi:hypothetical protein